MANDAFPEHPRHADSKNPILIFAEFRRRVTSGARGVTDGRILGGGGGGQLSFWGGGGASQRAVSTAPLPARPRKVRPRLLL